MPSKILVKIWRDIGRPTCKKKNGGKNSNKKLVANSKIYNKQIW